MTLTDPREALADQSNFIGYLIGLAGLGQLVHALAADGDRRADKSRDADDFVTCCSASPALGTRRATGRIHTGPTSFGSHGATLPTNTRWLR